MARPRLAAGFRPRHLVLGLCVCLRLVVAASDEAHAAAPPPCGAALHDITSVAFSGLSATREQTLLALLPRQPPTRLSRLELAELARRLNNLGIFDQVVVGCDGKVLTISVREKWTLVPEVDFSSGKTWSDTYALLGATEYNAFGTAHQLSVSAYREQRGFGMTVGFNEHGYQRRGWALGSEVSLGTAALRFEDGSGWRTTSGTVELSMRSPPWLHEYFNFVAGFFASTESVKATGSSEAPPSTRVAQSFMGFSWDAYEWHDLVPIGLQTSLWLSIGGLFGEERPLPRHTIELYALGAWPLGAGAVLVAQIDGAAGTRGNANYGILLGSVDGVRGLNDAAYFNWLQLLSNVELRQSLRLGERWALQGVLFSDAAAFEQLTAAGGRGAQNVAFSFGVGARVIPTWLSNVVLRLDASRLLAPELAWFTQLGLKQYF